MKEKIKTSILIVVVVAVLGGAFYWYEWRPTQAKKECLKKASDFSRETLGEKAIIDDDFNKIGGFKTLGVSIDVSDINKINKIYDFIYKNCLRKKGL